MTVDLRATNHLENTATKRYYFRTGGPYGPAGDVRLQAQGPKGTPKGHGHQEDRDLHQHPARFRVQPRGRQVDVADVDVRPQGPGGAPDRPVADLAVGRVVRGLGLRHPGRRPARRSMSASRPATASGRPRAAGGPTPDGADHQRWSSGRHRVAARFRRRHRGRPPERVCRDDPPIPLANGRRRSSCGPGPTIRSGATGWTFLLERALPILEREIGVPWPVDGPLAVHEALVRTTGGYAGLYAPADRRIEIAYTPSDGVILHELRTPGSTAGSSPTAGPRSLRLLLRRAGRGRARDRRGRAGTTDEPDAAAIPLNDWGRCDRQRDRQARCTPTPPRSTWPRRSRRAAGSGAPDGLGHGRGRRRRLPADQRDGADGRGGRSGARSRRPGGAGPGPPDWRGLLDLLEDTDGEDFEDLARAGWRGPRTCRAWTRTAARDAYRHSVTMAGEWRLPPATRAAMRAWQFETAIGISAAVDARPPAEEPGAGGRGRPDAADTLRVAFEGDAGIDAAAAEAKAEAAASTRSSCRAARPIDRPRSATS